MSGLLSCQGGAGPGLWATVTQPLHKPPSALARALNCTPEALEGPQDGFWQCLHSSAGFSIALLQLVSICVSSCACYQTVTPASQVLPRRLLTTDGGR